MVSNGHHQGLVLFEPIRSHRHQWIYIPFLFGRSFLAYDLTICGSAQLVVE